MSSPLIQVADLRRTYGKGPAAVEALRGVSFDIQAGEWVSITGASGSGKTTLLNVLGALDANYSGSVKLRGEELRGLSDRRLSRLRGETIGFVFQQFQLLPHLSVLENVSVPGFFRPSTRAENQARAGDLLARVGLADKRDAYPTQQRVAIARALFNRPSLLLCDEPTGALDKASGERVMSLFKALNEDEAIALVVVTHQDRIAALGSRAIVLEDGRVRSGEAAA